MPMYALRSTSSVPFAVCLLLGAALAGLAEGASAQAPAGQAASYTDAQSEAGRAIYEQSCVRCHGADLGGGEGGPPLLGDPLLYTWGGQRVTGLLRFVQTNMPMTEPGSLDAQGAAAVVAYVLSMNRVAAGDTPLSSSSTGLVLIPPGDEGQASGATRKR
jgi:mono/diheme cytochrome c family protein